MGAPSNSADGALNYFGRSCLESYSGQSVDLYRPDPATIDLTDIAVALGNTCRYGGHVRRFYSVAEHSVLVYELMRHRGASRELAFVGLLHDAAEAYVGDVIGPLKWLMTRDHGGMNSAEYTLLTEGIDRAIARRFGIRHGAFVRPDVKLADLWALRIEAAALTVSGGEGWRWTDEVLALGGLPDGVSWAGGLPPRMASNALEEMVESHLGWRAASDVGEEPR